ncbi:MAG: hypothetical protein ACI976_000777 [Aureispira sp.]
MFCLLFFGVSQTSNVENWLSIRLRYRIVKPLEVHVRLGYCSVDIDSDNTHIDVAMKYRVHKYLRLAIGWRHAGIGNPLEVDAIVNRFHIEASSRVKLMKRLDLKPRLGYQIRFKDWFESASGHIPKHNIRLRMLLNHKLHKRWTLIGGGALFAVFHYTSDPALSA